MMQYRLSVLGALGLAAPAFAAYIPSEPWSTLTPDSPSPSGAITDYASSFAIAVNPITSSVSTVLAKREAVVTQIGDGQIQADTTTTSTTAKTTAEVVSQIGDGQIQATTSTKTAKTTAQVVSQIGDGQIQATTSTKTSTTAKTTAQVVSQIGDGQIQATTSTQTTAQVVSQIGDGQIQATTTTATGASQITDGQVQAATTAASASSDDSDDSDDPVSAVACNSDGTLAMTLNASILTDSKGRIGSIVANRQFQFDGPPPQAGALYAAGWSITEEGNLAIGNNSVFYQCLSGSFYNLYDESIGSQCTAVNLEVVDLVDC